MTASLPRLLLTFTLVSASFAPGPGRAAEQPPADPPWRTAVQRLMEQRASAVLRGDERALRATMRGAPREFVDQEVVAARRLRALPLATYQLVFPEHGYDDLSAAVDADRYRADEVRVVEVLERVGFRRYDDAPASESQYLTAVRYGARWAFVSDTDVEPLGLRSVRWLWDYGEVHRIERGDVMVLSNRPGSIPSRILDATIEARRRMRSRWPYAWDGRVVVIIPRTSEQLGRILGVTFDLGPFVAFTGSSVDRSGGGYRLAGHRVYVQPDTFFSTSRTYQRETLAHELLHHATRAYAGRFTPAWIEELVAQIYGESAAPSLSRLRRSVRGGSFRGRLPDDSDFYSGSTNAIHVSYEASASFGVWLERNHGRNAAARLYRAIGREPPISPGTWRYHADHAARAVFERSLSSLERAWVRSIEEGFR